jgi:transporter family-2 protein
MYAYLLLALLAGLLLPFQAGVNSQLRLSIGHPVLAATVSFLIGSLALAGLTVLSRIGLPTAAAARGIPWWHWVGGLLGAFYVFSVIIVTPRLGAATMVATIVAGQMLASLVVDHYGVVGYPHHALNLWRLAGASLVIIGVVLIQRH